MVLSMYMHLFMHRSLAFTRLLLVARKVHSPSQAVMRLFVCVPVICTMYR